jgi:invasion protein IalB
MADVKMSLCMETHGIMEVNIHLFLTSTLKGDDTFSNFVPQTPVALSIQLKGFGVNKKMSLNNNLQNIADRSDLS